MFKSIHTKILFSFLLLILMLLTAGIMSVIEFHRMGTSVHDVLNNNYQSVESAKTMLDAVEREDSGILTWMLGNRNEGETIIAHSDSLMQTAIKAAKKNSTEKGEDVIIEKIVEEYGKYQAAIHKIATSDGNINTQKTIYADEAAKYLLLSKDAINALMTLNQDHIYQRSEQLIQNSQRAMTPGIVSIVAALLFALLLNFFILVYFIKPIKRIIAEMQAFYPEKNIIDCKIKSKDEIKKLESEINNLIVRLRHNNQFNA